MLDKLCDIFEVYQLLRISLKMYASFLILSIVDYATAKIGLNALLAN